MRKPVFILMIVIVLLLQVVFPRYLVFCGAKPDLLLLCAIMAGLLFKQKFAAGISIFIGLLKDSFGTGVMLPNTVLFPLWSVALVWSCRKISMSDPLVRTIVVAVVSLLHYMSTGLLSLYAGNAITPFIFLKVIFVHTVYTTLSSLVVCYFIEALLPQERLEADVESSPW